MGSTGARRCERLRCPKDVRLGEGTQTTLHTKSETRLRLLITKELNLCEGACGEQPDIWSPKGECPSSRSSVVVLW